MDADSVFIGFGLGQTKNKCVLTYQYTDEVFNHIMDALIPQSLVQRCVLDKSIDQR